MLSTPNILLRKKQIKMKNSDMASTTPKNMRRMNDPDGAAFINGICGDSMEMYLVIDDDTN